MKFSLSPSAESYLVEWAVTFAVGGAVFMIIGTVCGWIIWRNASRFTQRVEARNRAAFADYENTCDEISRIKSELATGGQ